MSAGGATAWQARVPDRRHDRSARTAWLPRRRWSAGCRTPDSGWETDGHERERLPFPRPPQHARVAGGRPPEQRIENRPGMVIEKDIAVLTGPGTRHVRRRLPPGGDEPAAPLVSWSPYGKHNPAPIGQIYPNSGVRPEWTSDLTTFEAPDPEYWVPHGYAIVLADVPGTWYSEGRATYHSPEEARAFADLVEWAGTQPWSAGKVGLSGVSYLSQPAVVRRRPEPAAPGRDQPVGGVERHLPRGRPARRHPGDLLLALHLGALGGRHHRDRGPGGRDGRAPLVRRVLGEQGRRTSRRSGCPPSSWPAGRTRACTRRGTLEGFRRIGSAAEVARRARPQEVGLLLRAGERRAPARLLRPLPAAAATRRPGPGRGCGRRCASGTTRAPGGPPGSGRSRTSSTGSCTWTPPSGSLSWAPGAAEGRRPTTGWAAGGPAPGHVHHDLRRAGRAGRPRAARCCTCPPPRRTDLDVFVALFKLDADGDGGRVPLLRAVRGRPGRGRLAARLAPGARPGALDGVSCRCWPTGARCRWLPAGRHPARHRDPAVGHPVRGGGAAAAGRAGQRHRCATPSR